jgi:outer membrane protein
MTDAFKTGTRISMKTIGLMSTLTLMAGAAHAEDFKPLHKGSFVINTRISTVAPVERGNILTTAGVDTGLDVKVNDDTVPTLGFTYFLTDHVAVEAILGTSKHTIKAVGPATDVAVHDTWVLPPVVAVQYHFNPAGKVNPYVGAGLNAMIFYSGKDKNGFTVKLDNGIGYAAQAGVDIALKGPWTLNLDAKKVWFNTDAKINGGALKSEVDLDPTVLSIGFGYRF